MKKIRFGTFNLFQFAEPPVAWFRKRNVYSAANWIAKKNWISERLSEMRADVVGFQEVFSPAALKNLVAENGFPYFSTADSPSTESEGSCVFNESIVALASKYPITSAEPVKITETIIKLLPINADFRFSRIPIRSQIDIEGSGHITVYISHLKSKRPMVTAPEFQATATWDDKVRETLRARSLGHVASMLQRGAEAAILYQDITNTLSSNFAQPLLLMGDLNDDSRSIAVEALTNRNRIYEIAGVDYKDLPEAAKRLIHNNKLYNSFDLAPNPSGSSCKATHYHKGAGGVLDYIFVSNAINERNKKRCGRIIAHKVYDSHLKDNVTNQHQSDHAQVVVEIEVTD
ncbi:endonuclease/exonuclease/phosphatase family protein [Candidatus Riflebacteria bacterium]